MELDIFLENKSFNVKHIKNLCKFKDNEESNPICKKRLCPLKRGFDIIFSLSVLVFLSPVFLFIALCIKINSPDGPIFYPHERIGLKGKKFNCWKFRTMIPDADAILKNLLEDPQIRAEYERDFKLKNDPRIVPVVGNFLRRTSLDELPQFLNSLLGDMSVVGPRPIVQEEMVKYQNTICSFLSVKPGITGLWQVSGRNDMSYNKRVELDMQYVNNNNFFIDLGIILKTIKIMLLKNGAY